jgi:sterol desaturase/sphingolipid hydroxylase (fatty acid hydroxylase superfamily)
MIVDALRTMPIGLAALLFVLENAVIVIAVVVLGGAIAERFARRAVCAPPDPLSLAEIATAASAVVMNSAVTLAGLLMWRQGIVRFRSDTGLYALADVVVLVLVMDLAMYVLHRIAHHPWLFALLHRLHHRYERVRPLTLFVLSPFEALSFGALWLVVITIYPSSWLGMSTYLTLNVAFGAIGHLGVEPLPSRWMKWPALRHLGTSTFHAQHHAMPTHNYGFYTLLWDRLFGTLDPSYDARP